jgi:hypothetical protein
MKLGADVTAAGKGKLAGLLSTTVQAAMLLKAVSQSGVARALWVLNYLEQVQGGRRAFKSKIPCDSEGSPLPWYTYPAIEYLRQLDFSRCSVFEYGSGNSSRFWAEHARSVASVESDPQWYRFSSSDLPANLEVVLRTGCKEYVQAIPRDGTRFDVIVIDGMYRYDCAVESVHRIREGGMILLDNSDWFPETARLLRDAGLSQVDFIGAGPVNSYAWCTSVFFAGKLGIPRKSAAPVRVLSGLADVSPMDRPSPKGAP